MTFYRKYTLFTFLIVCHCSPHIESDTVTKNGDYIIEFIQSIHEYSECNRISILDVLAVEAIISTINRINLDRFLLPNVTLGYIIHDDFGLQRQVALIAIKISQGIIKGSSLASEYRHYKSKNKSKGMSCRRHSGNTAEDESNENSVNRKPVIAVMGGSTSDTSVAIARNLRLLGVPIVNFMATSHILSRSSNFPTFIRVVPSDTFQAKAIFDLVVHFRWTYVFALTSISYYGLEGLSLLEKEASKQNVCLNSLSIMERNGGSIDETSIDKALQQLIKDRRLKVVIVFMPLTDAKKLFREVARNNITGITWIASEAWAGREEVLDLPPYIMHGIIGLTLNSKTFSDFKYLPNSLDLKTNKWMIPFLCQKYNISQQYCSLNVLKKFKIFSKSVSPFNSLFPSSLSFMWGFAHNAIYTAAMGLHSLLSMKNQKNATDSFNYKDIYDRMKAVRFKGISSIPMEFDAFGEQVNAHYDIVNLQFSKKSKKLKFVNIGSWRRLQSNDILQISRSLIKWNTGVKPVSRCSPLCQKGYKQKRGPQICCWHCERCPSDWVSTPIISQKCIKCQLIEHPNDDNSVCLKDRRSWFRFDSLANIAITVLSCIGEILSVTLLTFFSSYKKHRLYSGMPFKSVSTILAVSGFLLPLTFPLRHYDIMCYLNNVCSWLFYTLHVCLMFNSVGFVRHHTNRLNRWLRTVKIKRKTVEENTDEINDNSETEDVKEKRYRIKKPYVEYLVFALTIFVRIIPIMAVKFRIPVKVISFKISPEELFLYCTVEDWDSVCSLLNLLVMFVMTLFFANRSQQSNTDIHNNGGEPSLYDNDKAIYYEAFLMALVCFTFVPFVHFNKQPLESSILQSVAIVIIQYIFVICTYGTKMYTIYREQNKSQ